MPQDHRTDKTTSITRNVALAACVLVSVAAPCFPADSSLQILCSQMQRAIPCQLAGIRGN